MNEFYAVLGEIGRLTRWAMPTAGVSPFIAALVGLNPPWPNKIGLATCTAVIILVAVMVTFQFWRNGTKAKIDKMLFCAIIVLIFASVFYIIGLSLLTYETPLTRDAYVKGFVCNQKSLLLYFDQCPWLGLEHLKDAEWEAEALWTIPSITFARLMLLAAWVAIFSSFSVAIGLFVCHQQKKADRKLGRKN